MSTHDYYLHAYRTRGEDPQGESADTLYEPPSTKMVYENLHTPTNHPTKRIMTSTTTPMLYRAYPHYNISSPTPTKFINENRDEYLPRVVEGRISSRDDDNDTIGYSPAVVDPSQYLSKFVIGSSDIQSKAEQQRRIEGDDNEVLIRQSLERRKIFRGTASSSVRMTNKSIRENAYLDDRLHHLRSISEDTTITSNNTMYFNNIQVDKIPFHIISESPAMSTTSEIKTNLLNNITEREGDTTTMTTTPKSTKTSGGMRKDSSSSKSVAMKILCSKILAGYTLTRHHCPVCKMALVISSSSNDVAECAYCPIGQHRTTISEAVYQRIEAITNFTSLSLSRRRTVGGSRTDPPSVGEYNDDDNNGIEDNIYCDECSSPKCSTMETNMECKVCSITNDVCIKILQEQGKGGILLTDRTCLECGNPEMCHMDESTNCVVCEILLIKVGEVPRRSINKINDYTHATPPSESQPEAKEKEVTSSPLSTDVDETAGDGMICDAKFYDGYHLIGSINEMRDVQLPSVFVEEETCDSSPLGSTDEELRDVQLLSIEEITSSVSSFLVDGINEMRDVQLPYVEKITSSVSSFLVDGINELRGVKLSSVEEIISSVSLVNGTVHKIGIDSVNNVSSTTTTSSTLNAGVEITLGLGAQPSPTDVTKISKVVLRSRRRAHRTKRIGKSSAIHKTKRSVSSSPVVWLAKECPSKSWNIEGKGIVENPTNTKSDKAVKENKYIETIKSLDATKVHKAVGVDKSPNKSVIQCPHMVSDIHERARGKKEFDYTEFPEPTLAAAAAAGTANNDAKMMELMKSKHSSKSSRKDSKFILDKLEKIEEQQKRLVMDDNKDESIKYILKELKNIRHEQQMEIYTQHQRELLLQQKIHELEKETVNAGIQLHAQVRKIAAAKRKKQSHAVVAEQGYVDVEGQTLLQYKVGELNLSGVTEDDELTFQTLLSSFSSLGNSTYNVGGMLHRCVIDRCAEAVDIGHTITGQLQSAAADISRTITEQIHGFRKQLWRQKVLNGGGFKLNCGSINCTATPDGGTAEIKEDVIQTVEVSVNSFCDGLVAAVKSVRRCIVCK